jgi:Phospholipase_D-nuclease N-terminal
MMIIAVSTAVWVFILIPLLVVWAIAIVDIVRRPLSTVQTAAWILVVIVLPVIGTLIYFLVRKPTEEEVLRDQKARAELEDSSTVVHQRLPGE